MQRRIEQPDRHRQPGHRLEDPLEVGLLHRQEPVERGAPLLLFACQDHLANDRQPLLGHEHVLGAAEADALGAELARLGRVRRRVRVRAHAQTPQPSAQPRIVSKFSSIAGGTSGTGPTITSPGPAVDRDHVALAQLVLPEA